MLLGSPAELVAFARFCAAPVHFLAAAKKCTGTAAQGPRVTSDGARTSLLAVSGPGTFEVTYAQALASLHSRSATLESVLSPALRPLNSPQPWTAAPDRKFREKVFGGDVRDFDVVVLGSGIHEQIFQNVLRTEGDPLRVLTLERGPVVSETTTFAGDRVNSNSSVRKAGKDIDAVPGIGNINNFPGGPLQLDDVTTQGLPPLGNFGKVATVNRSLSPNPVLFGWEATKIEQGGGTDQPFKVTCQCTKGGDSKLMVLYARAVVDARGIGEPEVPEVPWLDVRKSDRPLDINLVANGLLKDFRDASPSLRCKAFPRIIHSKYFYECTSLLLEPYAPFADKTVAVVGGGDSGKTIMEFLARVGPNSNAYGPGVIAQGSATTIWVLGSFVEKAIGKAIGKDYACRNEVGEPRNFVTQAEYEKAARARYRPLGAKFPKESRDELGQVSCPLIDPIPGRLTGVEELASGRLKLTICVNNAGSLELSREVDVLVLATSLKPSYALYDMIRRGAPLDDVAEPAPGLRLSTSSPYAAIPGKKLCGCEIYFIGPGAGNFFAGTSAATLLAPLERDLHPGELSGVFGIAENVVAIFALGPISEGTARRLARGPLRAQAPGAVVYTVVQQPLPNSKLTFKITEGVDQQLSLALGDEAQLACALQRLDALKQQQLALFRLLWHLSASSGGCALDAPNANLRKIRAKLSTRADSDGAVRLDMLLKGCGFVEEDELRRRLQRDLVLQLLLRALLPATGDIPEGKQSSNVVQATLAWTSSAQGSRSEAELDLESSYVYIKPK